MFNPVETVHQSLRKHDLFKPGTSILLGVSGGADSVAMFHIFRRIARLQRISFRAAHFNHLLRGNDSDADARFVQGLCRKHKIPFHEGQENIQALYRNTSGQSLEEIARERRFSFFWKIMQETGSQYLALGHTADDQVETFLMRFLQGSRARGLGSISFVQHFSRGYVIHPLLELRKNTLLSFLKENQYAWRDDKTNQEKSFLRNRLRLELIPLLIQYNPRITHFITEYTEYFRHLQQYLQHTYTGWEQQAVHITQKDTLKWDSSVIRSWPSFQQNEFIHMFFLKHYKKTLKSGQVHQIQRFILYSRSGKRLSILNDIHLHKEYDQIILRQGEAHKRDKPAPLHIDSPGKYHWNGYDIIVAQQSFTELKSNAAIIPAGRYTIRSMLPGDRITYSQPAITKKIKKIFQEKRIPLSRRKLIPLLTSAEQKTILAVFLPERVLFSNHITKNEKDTLWSIHIENRQTP